MLPLRSGVAEAFSFLDPLNQIQSIKAGFVSRVPGVRTSTDKTETLSLLEPHHAEAAENLGFHQTHLAEQVHGDSLAIIQPGSPLMTHGVDGLLTQSEGILLGIHVADCGALYLVDRVTGALGLLHSGKKGTELNITAKAIEKMNQTFGSQPANLTAVLAPCIRPPHYEVDFAATIRHQALAAGILPSHFHDCGLCTGSDLKHFYSYRLEKGNTGRMIALLGKLHT